MRLFIAILAAFLATLSSAFAQSSCIVPGTGNPIQQGQVLTAAQWNGCFQQKNDILPYMPVNKAGDTMTGELTTAPSTVNHSGFNLAPGSTPTTPNNGDLWINGASLFARVNGVTYYLNTTIPGISVTSFGAKCDGTTDDTTALQTWASSIVAGGYYILPPSSCLFKSPLTFATVDNVTISGAGKQSKLLYGGATTTGNIVTMGTASGNTCAIKGWTLSSFRAMSSTVMTAGVGVLIGNMCDSTIFNFEVGGDINGNQNWYNAVHFSGGNTIHLTDYNFAASNIAEIINGDSSSQFSDMFQVQGEISHSAIGLNIAGNVGGFNIDQTDILLSGINVQIDQSQVALPNKQIFFGPLVDIDATSGGIGVGLNLIDAGVLGTSTIFFQGTWLASAQTTGGGHGYCVWIQSTAANWALTFNGNPIINCQGVGIQNDSTTSYITINNPHIDFNVGPGVSSSVSNPGLTLNSPFCGKNGQAGGCWNSNVNPTFVGGANGFMQGKITLYGVTSGSAFVQANNTGALQLGNNVGGLNTFFVDGTNGTAFAVGNAAGGTIAASLTAVPKQTGGVPGLSSAGTDTNIGMQFNTKGTGKVDLTGGTAPTLTAGCNGAGQVISGNDNRGTITGQTTASTSCTLTFSAAFAATPNCVVTGLSSPLTGAVTVGTTTLVVNFASTANYKWSYICLGN